MVLYSLPEILDFAMKKSFCTCLYWFSIGQYWSVLGTGSVKSIWASKGPYRLLCNIGPIGLYMSHQNVQIWSGVTDPLQTDRQQNVVLLSLSQVRSLCWLTQFQTQRWAISLHKRPKTWYLNLNWKTHQRVFQFLKYKVFGIISTHALASSHSSSFSSWQPPPYLWCLPAAPRCE